MNCCKAIAGVLVLLSITSLIAAENKPESITPKTRVIITNDFTDGSSVGVHCKSRDDDLGQQIITPGGTYEFTFHPNVFFNTLFFCHIASPNGWIKFDAYSQTRDFERCYKICLWSARGAALVGYNAALSTTIVYNWNHY